MAAVAMSMCVLHALVASTNICFSVVQRVGVHNIHGFGKFARGTGVVPVSENSVGSCAMACWRFIRHLR